MSKRTEGPWIQLDEFIEAKDDKLNDGYYIAQCPGPDAQGNASLISAAPDLLEALIEVTATLAWTAHGECRAIHDGPIMPSAMAVETAKAAIAKAIGDAK